MLLLNCGYWEIFLCCKSFEQHSVSARCVIYSRCHVNKTRKGSVNMAKISSKQNKTKKMSSKQKKSKKQQLIEKFGSFCWWGRQSFPEDQLTLDHVWPISKGGSNNLENLRLACFQCNNSRGDSLFPPTSCKTGNCR